MSIPKLTDVENWPDRILPQDRFDDKVQLAMNQMSVMVSELNNIIIPILNYISADDIPEIKTDVNELQESFTGLTQTINNISNLISGKANDQLMIGSSSSQSGSKGLVPPPPSGLNNRYLRSDGQWSVPPDSSSDLSSHTSNQSNPHQVTKEQIGLGNLPNAKSDSISLDDSGTLATSKSVKSVNDSLVSHVGNKSNPHGVTKAQIGLNNLPNAISDSTSLASSSTLATSKSVKLANDNAVSANNNANTKLPLSGGTITGNLTINGNSYSKITPDNAIGNEIITANYANSNYARKFSSDIYYVNSTTGSDTLDLYNGRGLSTDKPFKTLQACISYIGNNYNNANISVYINLMSDVSLDGDLWIKHTLPVLLILSYNNIRRTINGNGHIIATQGTIVQFNNIKLNFVAMNSMDHGTLELINTYLYGSMWVHNHSSCNVNNIELVSSRTFYQGIPIIASHHSRISFENNLKLSGTANEIIYANRLSIIVFEQSVSVTNNMTSYTRKLLLDTLTVFYNWGRGSNFIPNGSGTGEVILNNTSYII